jgi:Papain family cysteine protease
MPKRSISVGGKTVTLDARPDRLDLRDREFLPPVCSLPPQFPTAKMLSKYLSSYVKSGLVLDQGQEGACTGYGLAAVVNYLLWTRALDDKKTAGFRSISPHMLYDLAQFYDEWPGEDYEGSSCRGAMKGWHKHGVCEATLWKSSVRPKIKTVKNSKKPYKPADGWARDAATRPVGVYFRVNHKSVVDMQAAILNMGAIYVSADVHGGWDIPTKRKQPPAITHANLPVIKFDAHTEITGGHAFALVGYNENGFVVQNSWGTDWGVSGFAMLTYADWVANGADAWVCSLGVPQAASLTNTEVGKGAPARQNHTSLMSGDSVPGGKDSTAKMPPWPSETAYQHTVVAGNNGQVRMCLPDIGTPEGLVELIVKDNIGKWLNGVAPNARKVVIYAHGGLNKEEDSIDRIRILAPYFLANGIYPLFYTWRTGVWETIQAKLEDLGDKVPPEKIATGFFSDAKDHLLESIAHAARWIWNEMKDNAQGAKENGRALALIAANLKILQDKFPGTEFHLVGHSAGSFVHGYLLDLMEQAQITPASLSLYAPACSLEFADSHLFGPGLIPADKTWLHLLDDKREQDDTAGPYGKSLLYLVCRGFEEVRKTPISGLQHCIDEKATKRDDDLWRTEYADAVFSWRKLVNGLPAQADGRAACEIVEAGHVFNGRKFIPASHGSFDNNQEVIERTINRILGNRPDAKLAVPVDDLGE